MAKIALPVQLHVIYNKISLGALKVILAAPMLGILVYQSGAKPVPPALETES